jgi:Na+-driven multidrug efflux pump
MSIGAGDQARAERIGWIGSFSAAALAGSVGLILAVTGNLWIPVFTQDPAIHAAALSYIRIVGPCFIFMGLGFSLYFASQGAGAMLWPVAATITRIFVAVGGALLLTRTFDFGLDGFLWKRDSHFAETRRLEEIAGLPVYTAQALGQLTAHRIGART